MNGMKIRKQIVICVYIAGNLTIVPDKFEYDPFAQEGGMGRVYQLFGAELPKVLEAMNRELAA